MVPGTISRLAIEAGPASRSSISASLMRSSSMAMTAGLPSGFAGADCAKACGMNPTMASSADTIATAERLAKIIENSTLKISRDRLELGEHTPGRLVRPAVGGGGQAVVDVIVDQGLLRLADRLLDGVQLLRQVETWSTFGEHRDDLLEVPVGAFQPLDDLRVACVNVVLAHDF